MHDICAPVSKKTLPTRPSESLFCDDDGDMAVPSMLLASANDFAWMTVLESKEPSTINQPSIDVEVEDGRLKRRVEGGRA